MCEVQGVGGSGDPLPPSEKLSVLPESEEEQKLPLRYSVLDSTGRVQETHEGSEKVPNESGEGEASKIPLEIANNMDQKQECGTKEEEKEKEIKIENKVEIVKDVEGKKEEETVKEKGHRESECEVKGEERCVSDENERENQENERRDEMLENRVKMEEEMTEEKMAPDGVAEENKRGNGEEDSGPDSQKDQEPPRQEEEKEEVKETKKNDEKEIVNKEEEKDDKSNDTENEKTTERQEALKVEEKEEEEEEEKNEKEVEKKQVEPIKPCMKEPTTGTTTPKVAKTVNFLESELKARNESKRHTINAFSSSSSSSSSSYRVPKSKEEGDAREEDLKGLEGEAKERRHWTLGEGNPVYRLSMKLSPNLFNSTDIPGANQHKEVEKTGFLTKLSGRSFPYIAQWKRRYCVLSKGRLYYYEKEDSKAGDKSNGVIQLEYFDHVAEAGPKECKKATNVFIVTSQDRSFFDPGRHVFSADTLPDMKDWIRKIQAALDQIRNNNRPITASPSTSPPTKEGGGKRRRDEALETKEKKESQTQTTTGKERRKKKEETSRPRKSSRMGASSQTQSSMVEPMTCEVDSGRAAVGVPKGGVMLPGFSARKEPTNRTERSGDGEVEGDLPQVGPTLISLTKNRVQGPKGQRAPRKHRRDAAAALKKRASSLSALEHQDASDNRSESSEGATRSYRDSQTSEGDLKEETETEEEMKRKKLKTEAIAEEKEEEGVQRDSPESLFIINNIEDDLFFKDGLKDVDGLRRESLTEGKSKRRSSGLRVNFEESRSPHSKNGTLGRFIRLKDSFVTSKRNKFVAKESLVADHPDMARNSRWNCVIL